MFLGTTLRFPHFEGFITRVTIRPYTVEYIDVHERGVRVTSLNDSQYYLNQAQGSPSLAWSVAPLQCNSPMHGKDSLLPCCDFVSGSNSIPPPSAKALHNLWRTLPRKWACLCAPKCTTFVHHPCPTSAWQLPMPGSHVCLCSVDDLFEYSRQYIRRKVSARVLVPVLRLFLSY